MKNRLNDQHFLVHELLIISQLKKVKFLLDSVLQSEVQNPKVSILKEAK